MTSKEWTSSIHGLDSILHQAAFTGDVDMVATLLDRGQTDKAFDINARNRLGCTALRLAATVGHTACLDLILRHGADVNAADIKAQTPLFVAVKNRHIGCVRSLLAAGAEPNGNAHCLSNPVFIASMEGYTEGLQELLYHGANPNRYQPRVNSIHQTPIYMSIAYHHLECLRILLVGGANPDINFSDVQSPTRTSMITLPSTDNNTSVVTHHLPSNTDSTIPPSPLPAPTPPRPWVVQPPVLHSLYHATVKHNVEAEYVQLLYDFGASLYRRNVRGRLACERDSDNGGDVMMDNECSAYIRLLMANPRSLMSTCRVTIRHCVGWNRLKVIRDHSCLLMLPPKLCRYLLHEI